MTEREKFEQALHEFREDYPMRTEMSAEWGFEKGYMASSQQRTGWQPIESAPKDGTKFLAWRGGVEVGYVQMMIATQIKTGEKTLEPTFYPAGADLELYTHWQPLPQPPQEK